MVFVLGEAGTWPGITLTPITLPAILILALLVIAWLLVRARSGSTWHRTPLDPALPLWLLAFAISTAANWSMRSNIAVGLWFAGLYLLSWYITYGVLSNRLLSPDRVLDALFLTSIPILISARPDFPVAQSSRVSGLLQNPNILGAFLILLIPLIASRVREVSGYARACYVALLASASVVLLLTGSRGGIFGVCASFGLILFYHARCRERILIAGFAVVLGLALLGIRGDSGRLQIYKQAGLQLSSQWLTGEGLFTFRTTEPPNARLARLHPDGQNLHAHNVWLQVTVELGVVGLLALVVSVVQFARKFPVTNQQRWCFAAVFGLLAQQMVDFTIMTPSIALCAILVLAMAVIPDQGKLNRSRWPVWLLGGLALTLILAGLAARYVPNYMF
jgi:O-antigen ligase